MKFMENPLITGFVEKQHKAKTWAWKRQNDGGMEGQANPSDCHKIAKIMSDEDFL
jgi:hypothetical protein